MSSELPEYNNVTRRQLEALLDDDAREILAIVGSDMTSEEKMKAICKKDRMQLARSSKEWGELLGVSDGAIRKLDFWKTIQHKLL